MRSVELLNRLRQSGGVFSTHELAQIIGTDTKYASLVAHRLVSEGRALKATRGVYYLPGASIYAIASNIIYPSYISMFSAFKYYGVTSQEPRVVEVVTTRRRSTANIEGFSVRFVTLGEKRFFGFHRDRQSGAFVAELEKALADALYLNDPPAAYVLEAAAGAYNSNQLDIRRLMAYLEKMHSKAAMSRGGSLVSELKVQRMAAVIVNG